MANSIRNKTKSLCQLPKRGTLEHRLIDRDKTYRFILFKRIPHAEIKILYYLDELKKVVYVTDFFPTEKDDNKIADRNK